jgi:hypothetical protein
VIVKKIARATGAPAKSKAAHVRALADYIAGPQAGGHGEKVEHRGALNLLNLDHDGQVEEMIDLAETARRSPQPVQHWILSWREGEQPTTAQADEAVKMFLGEMGLAEHQAIYALHRDTHNWHLHLAINRVHPDTEKLITVNGRFDHEIAHRAIARIEQLQHWEPEAYALYGPDAADQITRLGPRNPSDRKLSVNARDFEERRGERSAERVGIEDAAPIIRQAKSWRELHDGLAAKGMRFEKKGSGALLWVGDRPVKASAAGRDCSMAGLRKRLGEFESIRSPAGPSVVPPRPVASGPTLELYIAERRKYLDTSSQREHMVTRHQHEWRQMVERHRTEREDIFRGSWRGKRELLNALRSVTAARHAQEKAELRDRQGLERSALAREQGVFPPYEQWLARGDRDAADEWRHRDRRPATIEGPTFKIPTAQDIRGVQALITRANVNYYMAGSHGKPSFTDRGKTIDIHDTKTREIVLAALQLSAQKWGTISVRGDDQFKRTCVEFAVEHGFKIVNPELQRAIDAEREQRTRSNREDREAPSRSGRQQLMTPAAIYRRHRDAIVRDQSGQRIDPSRVDAWVAVRMAVTAHSYDQIADAIKAGASADRPGEKRDWEQYALRAANHAFSPPGMEMRERLAGERDNLIRLEGRQDELDLLRRLGGPMRGL